LYAVIAAKGNILITEPISLGDRVNIEDVKITSGKIILKILKHKPNDPLCCPTLKRPLLILIKAEGWSDLETAREESGSGIQIRIFVKDACVQAPPQEGYLSHEIAKPGAQPERFALTKGCFGYIAGPWINLMYSEV